MRTDIARWGGWAIALVWIWLAADAAIMVASLDTIYVLGGFTGGIASPAALEAADRWSALAGIVFVIAFVAAGIAVLRWIFLTNRRAHQLSDMIEITPGWAVGWFFVPFANLWKPFEGVRDTWRVSVDPSGSGSVETPAFLRWWWGAWIVSNALGNVSFRLSMGADTPGELIAANWVDVWSFGVDCILAVALVRLIRRLTALQEERAPIIEG